MQIRGGLKIRSCAQENNERGLAIVSGYACYSSIFLNFSGEALASSWQRQLVRA